MTDLLEVHSAQGIKGLLKLYSGGFGETHVIATGKAREDFAFFGQTMPNHQMHMWRWHGSVEKEVLNGGICMPNIFLSWKTWNIKLHIFYIKQK